MSSDPSALPSPSQLVADLKPLPPVAQVLARLQMLLSDPNSGLDDIADLIRLDAALTTRVIQISNSVWFRRGLQSSTISEAVNRVGFREVYRMVGVVASSAIVAQPLTAYNRLTAAAWRESVAGAFAAEMLAERLGEDMPGAYMAGLLHGVGRLPINQYLIAPGAPSRVLAEESFPHDHSGAEYALFGFTQAEVGALMLEKWGFSPAVSQPIKHQYAPLEAGEAHDRMAAVLYGARLLRSVCCQQLDPAGVAFDEQVLGVLRLSVDEVLAMRPALDTLLARATQMTKL
jgi:HD-like signal output (HDOD) protein